MKKLRKLLSTDYISRFNEIEKIMYNIAGKTKIFFPTYTNHGTDHLKNVEKYVNSLIPDDVKERMSQDEIFFLLCGIWLHDVGMIPKDEDELIFFKNLNPEERNNFTKDIRDMHHIRSSNYIKENHDELGLSKLESKIIGQIAKGHRKIELNDLENINYNGSLIKIPNLAAILRITDECDVSKDRESSLSDIDVDEETRKNYYKKIKLVNHVWFNHKKGIIFVSAIIDNEEDMPLINEVIDEIKKKLNQTSDFLVDFGINFYDVRLDGHLDKIYEKKIISKIADNDFEKDDLIYNELSRNKINEIIQNLTAEGLFNKKNYKNGFKREFNVYKKLFEKFEGPSNLKMFFFTGYSQEMVDVCFKVLSDKFQASFGRGMKNRIYILKNSPTAFHMALSFDKIIGDENFKINSCDDGSTIIDHLLLMSLFNDINYYRDLINFNEVEKSIKDLIKDETEIINEIKKYKLYGKIDQTDEGYKINSLESSKYLKDLNKREYLILNDEREIIVNCSNIHNLNSEILNKLNSTSNLVLELCNGEYKNNMKMVKEVLSEKFISMTYSSEELPFKLTLKIITNDESNKELVCSFYSKSSKISDMLIWSKFQKECSEKNVCFSITENLKFWCELPKLNIMPELIEFYEIANNLNMKFDLDLMHEKYHKITLDEYRNIKYIRTFLDKKIINVPSINVKTNIKVSELKEFLENDLIPIEVQYDHFPIRLLNNNIDLGRYNVNILAAEIMNKTELNEIIQSKDLDEVVNVTLVIKNKDSDYVVLNFS